MAIDADPLTVALALSKRELDTGVEQALTDMTVAGVLSLLPGVGSAIQSLIDGKARRNVERRWVELFADLKEQIDAIRDTIPDDAYYGTEEFQTLLALAYEQLLTTHDRAKLKMLATGLANSGSARFQADDKELMIRALRNLSPNDLQALNHKYLKNWTPLTKRIEYEADVLGSLSRLASTGLVTETFLRPNPNRNDEQKLQTLLTSAPWRTFQLAPFGERFLKFVAAAPAEIGP